MMDNNRSLLRAAAAVWLLLLLPAEVARSEIVLEPIPLRRTTRAPTPSRLPIYGQAANNGQCQAPSDWPKEEEETEETEEVEEEYLIPEEPSPCKKLETRLPELPNIMHSLGWTNGESLMRGWFSRPANDEPGEGIPDNSTITMDWVLGYERAKKVYDQAIKDKVWVNAAAQKLIENKLLIRPE